MHHVLIVDDQPGIRLLLEEIMKIEGFEVTTAINGKDALEKIEARAPDLMLVDYKLPVIDGLTLVKQLESEGTVIPTIIMTGMPEKISDEVKTLKSVQTIFSKPFNINDARSTIKAFFLQNK